MLNSWVLNSNAEVQVKNPIFDSRCDLVYHVSPMHPSPNYLHVMRPFYGSWGGRVWREFKTVRQVWKLDALLTHQKESCLGKRAASTPTFSVGILQKKRRCPLCLRGRGCQASEKSPHVTLVARVEMVVWRTNRGMKEATHMSTPSTLVSFGSRVASKISYGFQRDSGIIRERKWWPVCQNVYRW